MRAVLLLAFLTAPLTAADRPPNIVLIVADDLGYADVGSYGAKDIRTPNLDRLAKEGTRFTNFNVAQPVCTASRAALMSGCYPNRIGLAGALNHTSTTGIHPNETLLPEYLKRQGYATACFGKWHLGTRPMFDPTKHGFDTWFGLPYSNDNGPLHPVIRTIPALPLIENGKTVELDPDQSQFTKRFTEKATAFIAANKAKPFFLYLPHVMPHVPIFASEAFKGKSVAGLYGDVVEELDASVGTILDTLQAEGLERDTLVIFFSDNGPFLSYGDHAGSAGPLREGKLTSCEGGVRVPCIMRWPGRVPAGSACDEPVMATDLLPTICELTGAPLPERKLDGLGILPLIEGRSGARSPHEALFFYAGNELQAVRSGRWKLHFAHPFITVDGEPGKGGKPAMFGKMKPQAITQSGIGGIATRHGYRVEQQKRALYDLETDIGETRDLSGEHPEEVARLERLAAVIRVELGDSLHGVKGRECRPAGRGF